MDKIEKKFFLIILLISIITFIFSSLRDIDFFGKNFDDKMALYYISIIDTEKDNEKIDVIKDLINSNCKSIDCKNRHFLRLNQNNNYLVTSSVVKFFDKVISDENELIKISRVVNYSFIITLLLFYSFVVLYSYKSNKETKLHILFLLLLILLIDKKLLNLNLGFLLPNYEYYNNYLTEYIPRSQAIFFSVLSIIFCFRKKYLETVLLLILTSLFHFAIGISLLLIYLTYYVFLEIKKLIKLDKFFFRTLLIFSIFISIFINQFTIIPLILLTIYITSKYKFNSEEENFISFLVLVISGLFFLDTLFVYSTYIISSNSSNYLSYILPSTNFIHLFNEIEIFFKSNFFNYLKHASSYLSPIFLISYIIIMLIKFDKLVLKLFKKFKFFNLKSKLLIFILIISLIPFLFERLIYIKNIPAMIDEDLILGLKKENTFEYATQYKIIKIKNLDFGNEIFSQFMILKFIQGDIKYE